MSNDKYEPQEQTPEQKAKIERELDSMVTNWDERVETFDAMGLREELLRGIYSYGYERPSVVQQKCIMPLIRYVSLLCNARTLHDTEACWASNSVTQCSRSSRFALLSRNPFLCLPTCVSLLLCKP